MVLNRMRFSNTLIHTTILVMLLMLVSSMAFAADVDNIDGHQDQTGGIEISKDTVVYDVSEFISSDCIVLKELLAALPGLEIDDQGQMYAFGQPVTDWCINGVSSLFEYINIAINTFPAVKVKCIYIYDSVSNVEGDSGIADMDAPTKEVNIILTDDAFVEPIAHLKLSGGYGGGRFLYDGVASFTKYTAKGNVGVFASGADNMQVENETEDGMEGMLRAYDVGIHYYTEAIKNFTLKAAASYNNSHIDEDRVASRQTLFNNSIIGSETSDFGTFYKQRASIGAELKSNFNGKFHIEIDPQFNYTGIESQMLSHTQTRLGDEVVNNSKSQGVLRSNEFLHSTKLYMTYSNFGKPDRVMLFTLNYYINSKKSDNKEFAQIDYTSGTTSEITDLLYENKYVGRGFSANLEYVEPIGKNWFLNMELLSQFISDRVTNDAYSPEETTGDMTFDFNDRNLYSNFDEMYSSYSDSRYFMNNAHLLAQYKKGETTLQFGGYGQVLNNELFSRTAELSETTGAGEYIWDWSPFIKFSSVGKKGRSFMVNYIGSSSNLPNSLLVTAPNISDPSHITFGNIYLKPGFENNLNFYYSFNSKKKFNLMYLNFNISRKRRAVVDATWFDKSGVQYSIPVNAEKVTRDFSLEYNFSNIPVDRGYNLILNLSLVGSRAQYYSYQAIGESEIIDMQNFDYMRFMKRLWGERRDGEDFYSGDTGFKRSKRINTSISGDLNLEYSLDNFTFTLGASAERSILKYSLDRRANMNTWVVDPYFILEYETCAGLKMATDFDCKMYYGYSEAYAEPGFMWNFHISKRFRHFVLTASVDDILDDASYFHRVAIDNYVEESVTKHLGRRVMLGVAFDF